MKPMPHAPSVQMPLIPMDDELVLRKARELFDSSELLRRRWPSFDKAMEHPNVGRCLRMNAMALLRRGSKKRGRR